jgi:hypothetical protein
MLSVPPTVAIREGGHERVLVDTTKNLTSQFWQRSTRFVSEGRTVLSNRVGLPEILVKLHTDL